jgi:hypothetical protein
MQSQRKELEVQIENLTIENQRLSELKMSGTDGKQ